MTRRRKGFAAFAGKTIVTWTDIADATGLAIGSLKTYRYRATQPGGKLPPGVTPNAWDPHDPKLLAWITEKLQHTPGYRSDLYGPTTQGDTT